MQKKKISRCQCFFGIILIKLTYLNKNNCVCMIYFCVVYDFQA